MPHTFSMRRAVPLVGLLLAAGSTLPPTGSPASAATSLPGPVPRATCDRASQPETGLQGDVPAADVASGRELRGYYCNAQLVSTLRTAGGYRVERYTDKTGHTCAYFDADFAQTVHPVPNGVDVVDMKNPAHPRLVTTLRTPGMLSPHEGLRLNQKRGLLVAATAFSGITATGTLDVYSVANDCTQPKLLASAALGLLGHESGFAPDGKTFWVSSNGAVLSAVDLTNPSQPSVIYQTREFTPHGLSVSDDGNTLFLAGSGSGLVVLDDTEVQERKANPTVKLLSRLTWPEISIPQNATPFRSHGHDYVVETDELGGSNGPRGGATVPWAGAIGAARIINVDDLRHPKVVSHLRLAVNNTGDGTFAAHYCDLPSRVDPAIIACGFVGSGLRVFDVRTPRHPKELAYANFTNLPPGIAILPNAATDLRLSDVYSAPAYDPARHQIWFADASRGLMVVQLTGAAAAMPWAPTYRTPGS